jgi:CO/xanthine dehydrogenase FAD-binding subunit
VRTLPVADLVTGDGTTALAPGELIRALRLPAAALASRTAFRRLSLSNLGRSGVLLIGRHLPGEAHDGGMRLTVTASTKRPVRLDVPAACDAGGLAAALEAAIPPELYHDDLHGHPRWRRDMTHLLAEQIRRELRPR